jgi:integrase
MSRHAQPWYRSDRKIWCVTINGIRHKLGPNKKKAFERFHELMRQPSREKVVAEAVASILDPFLDWVERNRSAATFEWYRCRLQSFVERYPELTIDQLRPYHVEQWAGAPHLAVTSRRNLMRSVKRAMKWAVSQGYLEKSPIEHMEVPGGQAREVYIPPDEFSTLLDYVIDPNFADLLVVTYECGCRPQESLRVEARHVDLARYRWVFPPSEAKTKSMPRIVYLSERAAAITAGLVSKHPAAPLFRNRRDHAWTKDAIGCAFDRLQVRMAKIAMKAQGIVIDEREVVEFSKTLAKCRIVHGVQEEKPRAELLAEARRKLTQRTARTLAPHYSLYALRHSWATNALRNGVDSLTVAILMGHRDPSTLARTYQHLSHNPGHLLAEARRASVALG